MALEISKTLPSRIRAGDSIEFIYIPVDSSYVDSAYTATTTVINSSAKYSADSSTLLEGGFYFDIPSATSSEWTAGDYTLVLSIKSENSRHTISQHNISVLPDLTSPVDLRTTNKQIFDALVSTIEGSATYNQLKMSIAGRSIERMTLEELITAKNLYAKEVADEERAERVLDGKSKNKNIMVRFR